MRRCILAGNQPGAGFFFGLVHYQGVSTQEPHILLSPAVAVANYGIFWLYWAVQDDIFLLPYVKIFSFHADFRNFRPLIIWGFFLQMFLSCFYCSSLGTVLQVFFFVFFLFPLSPPSSLPIPWGTSVLCQSSRLSLVLKPSLWNFLALAVFTLFFVNLIFLPVGW